MSVLKCCVHNGVSLRVCECFTVLCVLKKKVPVACRVCPCKVCGQLGRDSVAQPLLCGAGTMSAGRSAAGAVRPPPGPPLLPAAQPAEPQRSGERQWTGAVCCHCGETLVFVCLGGGGGRSELFLRLQGEVSCV